MVELNINIHKYYPHFFMTPVPVSLRYWFVVHFVLDFSLALALLSVPGIVLDAFGLEPINFVLARLIGAALIAIGGTSLLMRNKSIDAYKLMLILKLLWSGSAMVGIGISLLEGAPILISIFLVIFALFFILWAYYLNQIKVSSA